MFGHVTNRLSAYCHGELPPAGVRRVEAHVAQCEHCRRELDEIRLGVALASHLERVPAPETLWLRVEAGLEDAASRTATVAGAEAVDASEAATPVWQDWRAWGALAVVLVLAAWFTARWDATPRGPAPERDSARVPRTSAPLTPVQYDLGEYLGPVQAVRGESSFQRISSAPPRFADHKRDEKFPTEWLNRVINGPEPLPGYKLDKTRMGWVDNAPIVQLVYEKDRDKAFSVFVAPTRVEFKYGREYAYETEVGGIACRKVDCPLQKTFEFGEGGFKCVLVTKTFDDATAARVMNFFLEAYRN
ncbi:MAG: anti-sigma factor family protein [Candidatus Acidiferrales bacterium]